MKFVVADDNRTVTKVVKIALEEDGYEVFTANSLDDAKELLLSKKPDIALIDTKFEKDKDGYALVRKVRPKLKDTRFILLVSALEKPDIELMEKLGIQGYLTKPVDSRKLMQIIEEIKNSLAPPVSEASYEKSSTEDKLEEEKESTGELVEEKGIEVGRREEEGDKSKEISEEKKEGEWRREEEGEEGREVGFEVSGIVTQETMLGTKGGVEATESDKLDNIGVSDTEVSEEKRDISFGWAGSTASKFMEEITSLLLDAKKMFESVKEIKDEAQLYVKEVSQLIPELKRKIEDVPDAEKIISRVTSEIYELIEKKISSKIRDIFSSIDEFSPLKNKLEEYIDTMQKRLKDEVLNYVKSFFDEFRGTIIADVRFRVESIEHEVRNLSEKVKKSGEVAERIDSDIIDFKEKFEKQISRIDTLERGFTELRDNITDIVRDVLEEIGVFRMIEGEKEGEGEEKKGEGKRKKEEVWEEKELKEVKKRGVELEVGSGVESESEIESEKWEVEKEKKDRKEKEEGEEEDFLSVDQL